jgi:hypothetical protein
MVRTTVLGARAQGVTMTQRTEEESGSMEAARRRGRAVVVFFAVLHMLCCGVPLLLLSAVSLQFLVPWWPLVGVTLMVLGVVGFIWYLKRGCATCPRKEGRRCVIDTRGTKGQPAAPHAGG